MEATLNLSLHLQCTGGDLISRRPTWLVDANQSREGTAKAIHLTPDPVAFAGVFEIEFDDAVIVIPVDQVGDGPTHHLVSRSEQRELEQLPDAGLATLIGADDPDQGTARKVLDTQFLELEESLGAETSNQHESPPWMLPESISCSAMNFSPSLRACSYFDRLSASTFPSKARFFISKRRRNSSRGGRIARPSSNQPDSS